MFELTPEEQALHHVSAQEDGSVVITPTGRRKVIIGTVPFLVLGFVEVFLTSSLRRNTRGGKFPFSLEGPPLQHAWLVQFAGIALVSGVLLLWVMFIRTRIVLRAPGIDRIVFLRRHIAWAAAIAVYSQQLPKAPTPMWQVVIEEGDFAFPAFAGSEHDANVVCGLIDRYRRDQAGPWPGEGGFVPMEERLLLPMTIAVGVLQLLSWVAQS